MREKFAILENKIIIKNNSGSLFFLGGGGGGQVRAAVGSGFTYVRK